MSLAKVALNLVIQQTEALLDLEAKTNEILQKYQGVTQSNAQTMCPSKEVLESLLRFKIQSEGVVNLVVRKLNTLRKITATADQVSTALSTVLVAIKANPAPSVGLTLGATVTTSDILEDLKDTLKTTKGTATSITTLVTFVLSKLEVVQSSLSRLDTLLGVCGRERGVKGVEDLPTTLAVEENRNTQEEEEQDVLYKGYKISIRITEDREDGLLRRQAIGTNLRGIIEYSTSPSFATSNRVLIDQIKLKIDTAS